MQQFTKIIESRRQIYAHAFTRERDAQFELLDALLLNWGLRSYPELSLSPAFRRKWPSVYKAMERGRRDVKWLERYLVQHVPATGLAILPLDATAWPHPQARVLADRQYVYSPTGVVTRHSMAAGPPYSILVWCAEPGSSWALPVSVVRVQSSETDVAVGVRQVQAFCEQRGTALAQARFAFKEPETWPTPDEECEIEDVRWGQVRLQRWDKLHALQDAQTAFSALCLEVHCEREHPPEPLWLGYQHPQGPMHAQPNLEALWRGYAARRLVESHPVSQAIAVLDVAAPPDRRSV